MFRSPNEGQEVSYEKLLDGATKPDATTKGDKSTLIAKQVFVISLSTI